MNNQEKFSRRKNIRLRDFDYSSDGAYFITICTHKKRCFFGEIKNEVMGMSLLGVLANGFWQKIPHHFPFVHLDSYVVMPNHIHGILWIEKDLQFNNEKSSCSDVIHHVQLKKKYGGFAGLKQSLLNPFSISNVIRWHKARTTFEIRKYFPPFSWQPRFNDRIIRNDEELNRVRDYIIHNPSSWNVDKERP